MKKVILSNGVELNPILIKGANLYTQGANRDSLTFVFPATESMEALDSAFSDSACESIIIFGEDGAENIYKHYVIRVKLEKAVVEVVPATPESEAVTEERISITMAQRTYVENQLAQLSGLKALLAENAEVTE